MQADVRDWAEKVPYLPLTSGDDYELLFTAPVCMRDQIQTCAVASNTPVTRIGQITAQQPIQVMKDAEAIPLPSQLGFDHFTSHKHHKILA
jgi:thiamine-monophosphate kinase